MASQPAPSRPTRERVRGEGGLLLRVIIVPNHLLAAKKKREMKASDDDDDLLAGRGRAPRREGIG